MDEKQKLTVQGIKIKMYAKSKEEYISLTDMAKSSNERTEIVLQTWLRNRNTIEFIRLWEELYNPNFNHSRFAVISDKIGLNNFYLSPKKWVEETNAIGIEARAGRYGGTYAHRDIAFEFASWLSPSFKLYLIKEFQRLKELEAEQREDQFRFDVRRELTKINWHRHQQAVKLLPPRKLDLMGERYIYANETDLLNLALFGMTAKKWQDQNPERKGNMRDHASIEQLTVLANLENINALLIENGLTQDERLQILNEEAIKQMEKAGDLPDVVVAPFGGGSNFAGIAFPFMRLNFEEGKNIRCIASEPASCPKLTKGVFRYDFGDTVGMTPLLPMFTLGHNFVPAPIHAGGLRYHGAGVMVSQLLKDKLMEARAHHQLECFEAGIKFAQAEGIIPAPEANHAIATVIAEAEQAKQEGKSKTILFNLCGHGNFDMAAYENYLSGNLVEHELTQEEISSSLAELDTPEIQ